MATQVFKFSGLSDSDRKMVAPLPKLAEGDRIQLHIPRHTGQDQIVALPPVAIGIVETLNNHLLSGKRVAIIVEDRVESGPLRTVGLDRCCVAASPKADVRLVPQRSPGHDGR
ncbi:hypothetical protein [Paracoccus luteus]|uniref:hypothetical protein n=1 Tax=Paracoccus luteus TaxID=2508543 RepID=UPI00106F0B4D|nr:hypothetical protein [Paracoccus luteus]